MAKKVFVFDPTASDKLSSVRGVGRYLQILKENFAEEFTFTSSLKSIKNSKDSVFINPFFNFLASPLTLKHLSQKQIAVIHDLIPLKYPAHYPAGIRGNINIFLNTQALKNYDLIITDSEASKKDIRDILHIEEGKIKVIYPCLPKSFSKLKIENLDLNENFCLYVGDATWNKNLVNLVQAIKIINVTCVFVGNVFGSQTRKLVDSQNNKWLLEYKQFLMETKDDKRFIFKGFLPDSDLLKLYQQAKLNVLPSRDEGFGFSYLESASQGCPSVLSDILVLKEISAGNTLFADPENPNDIADKIGELYFNKKTRNAFSSKALQRSKFFSPKKFKKEFLSNIK